jgi:hypothetical protein
VVCVRFQSGEARCCSVQREKESLFLTHHHLIDTDFGYEIHFYIGLLCYIVTKASRLH